MIAEIRSISELSEADKAVMFCLFDRYFLRAHREHFESDLTNKDWAVIVRHPDGSIIGFSTMAVYQSDSGIVSDPVLCSGDTIVDKSARGSTRFLAAWLHAVRYLRHVYGCDRFQWLLIVSGFRTYRLLPVFWREFHARYDRAIPPRTLSTMQELAAERFGTSFDSERGIVRFSNAQVLRNPSDTDPKARLADPHIAYFNRLNPGHASGDELVTLTELSDSNLTNAGKRLIREPQGSQFLGARP
jgi:hypothetical protein